MNIAPIQMINLTFRRLSVEADFEHHQHPEDGPTDPHALLEGVRINAEISSTRLDEPDPRGARHFVTLRVRINNDFEGKDTDHKPSPYLVDVEGGAVIVLNEAMQARPDAEDLVVVNGPALIWGAIREQVALMTSRMPAGTALLPSVNFHDLKRPPAEGREASNAATSAPATEATSSAKPKRPRSRKS